MRHFEMEGRRIADQIVAIGFDLFNTLITVRPHTLDEAMERLVESLKKGGFHIEKESFRSAYRETAQRFLQEARRDGKETHNRYWISAALKKFDMEVSAEDPCITAAVEDYFSAFYGNCHLIPGTIETLATLRRRYRIGLLSNFTHSPAAREIIRRMGLSELFEVILISGDLGYRKPHPWVFERLIGELGVHAHQALYVGDDPDPDIRGAFQAGLLPVLTTYARDHKIAFAPGSSSRPNSVPDDEVPRISDWHELLLLLDGGRAIGKGSLAESPD